MAQTHPCIKEKSIAFSFDSLVFMRSGFSSFSFLFLWNATGFLFLKMGSHEPKKIVFPFSLWRCYIYIYTRICIEDPNHNQITSFHRLTNSIFCFLDVFDNSSSRCRRTPPVAGSIFVFPGFSKFISLSLMLYHPVLSLVQSKDGKLMATFNPRQLNVIWGRDPRYWKMPEKWGSFCLFFELFLFLIRVQLWFWKESMLVSLI